MQAIREPCAAGSSRRGVPEYQDKQQRRLCATEDITEDASRLRQYGWRFYSI